MVEYVEKLRTKINALGLRNFERLQQREIGVADVRTTADGARRIADTAEQGRIDRRVFGEGRGIKEIVAITLRTLSLKRFELVGLPRQFKVEAVHQFVVGRRDDANREPRLECSDTGNGPAIHHLPSETAVTTLWQLPVVAQYNTMACVEGGKRAAEGRIDRIQNSFKAGCLVEGLAEGVGSGELQAMRKAFVERSLERVVGGV